MGVINIEERRKALGLVKGSNGRLTFAKSPAQPDVGEALRKAIAEGGPGLGAVLRALADALDPPKPTPTAEPLAPVAEAQVQAPVEEPIPAGQWRDLPTGGQAMRTSVGGRPATAYRSEAKSDHVWIHATDPQGNQRRLDVYKTAPKALRIELADAQGNTRVARVIEQEDGRTRTEIRDRDLNLHVQFSRDGKLLGRKQVVPPNRRIPKEWAA